MNINEFVPKIKKFLQSISGKCLIFIFTIAFLTTLVLSLTQKNHIIYSLLRGILSGVLASFIMYGVYIALSKLLGDPFRQIFLDTKEDAEKSADNINDVFDNNGAQNKNDFSFSSQNDHDNDKSKAEDPINTTSLGLNVPLDIDENMEDTVDKNSKVSYHNSNDDISSIVLGSDNNSKGTNGVKTSSDKESSKNVQAMSLNNPEILAKAVRTMRARDNNKEKENN